MSEDVRYKGKVSLVEGKEFVDFLKEHYGGLDTTLEDVINENTWKHSHIMKNGKLYKFELQELDVYDAMFEKLNESDEGFEFVTQFYTGGTNIEEMIEENL